MAAQLGEAVLVPAETAPATANRMKAKSRMQVLEDFMLDLL
jgi:hypothetical protein